MKTLIIEEGFEMEICNEDYEFINYPIDNYTTAHYEKAFNAIKEIALYYLNPNKNIEQVLIDDLKPLCQLFFWAILSLQKENKISKDLVIIVDEFIFKDYDCNSEKFSEANQEKIKRLAHVVRMMPYNYKVNKPCTFAQAESHYPDCETIELSHEIFFNEIEEKFESKY